MALQFDLNKEESGLSLVSAYAKVSRFNGNKEQVKFDVEVFVNQAARDSDKQPISYFNFEIPYTDGMSIASLYTYLKTLPEFAGALDV